MTAEEFLALLDGVRRSGKGWMAKCPAHDDDDPSLKVDQGGDGRILIRCHSNSGCTAEDIVSELGLTMKDLFPSTPGGTAKGKEKIVKIYKYKDENGNVLHETVRYEPKDFKQRRPAKPGEKDDGEGYVWNLRNTRVVLFRLRTLRAAIEAGKAVWVVEGEKDVLSMREIGLTATCNPMGAGKWREEFTKSLAGAKQVFITGDNDEPGRKHAEAVATSLINAGIVAHIVELPGPSKDVSEWIAAGGTVDELQRLAEGTPTWVPLSSALTPRWYTPPQLASLLQQKPPVLAPYLVEGTLTELDGYAKAGKTTWVMHLLRALLGFASSFLSVETKKTAVVYLNEAPRASFKNGLESAGLLGAEDLHILDWPTGLKWADVVEQAVEKAKAVGAKLLIVDTFAQWTGIEGDSENAAGRMLAEAQPLQRAARSGLAVLIIRHTRKAGGAVGESGRGSSALSGAVDIIVELKRQEGQAPRNRRVLRYVGRFGDLFPAELVVELAGDGYQALGAPLAARKDDLEALVIRCLAQQTARLTIAELNDWLTSELGHKPPQVTLRDLLKKLVREGQVLQFGNGRRASPFSYCTKKSIRLNSKTGVGTRTNSNAAPTVRRSRRSVPLGKLLAKIKRGRKTLPPTKP